MTRTAKKQNVTVSLHQETVRKARIPAAKRSASVSGLLAEQIEALTGEDEAYERAKRSALSLMRKGFPPGGAIAASRDELHER
jgi:hypothetical protein